VYVEYHENVWSENRFKKENLEILLFWKILKRQRATLFQSALLKIIYDTMKTAFHHHRGKDQKLKKSIKSMKLMNHIVLQTKAKKS